MTDRKTILVIVDPTADEQPALERAAWLAGPLGAGLELLICDYDQSLASHPWIDATGREQGRSARLAAYVAKLEKLAARQRVRGLTVTVDARWSRPIHRGIVAKVREARPLLVVKDTHYHDVLKRTLLSSTDWSLIRACPAPLLLVKPRAVGAAPRILAAVDPLHEFDKPAALDRQILAFASALATAVRGRLHVLHAYDAMPILAAASATPAAVMTVPVAEIEAELEREHRAALDKLLAGLAVDAADVHLEQGVAYECLVRYAAEQAIDFVVMGAVSRSGLQRIFIGNTAERVLDRLACDLIVVKPAGFAAPDTD